MKKGYVQIYTGNGKGKTTAALGLALRAVGAGLRVYIGQFLKKGNFSEIKILRKRFPEVTIEQFGRGGFIRGKPTAADLQAARKGLARLNRAMLSGHYDLIIADEANSAVAIGLLKNDELLQMIRNKPKQMELVFTGRNAHPKLVKEADLVTEMKAIKHYIFAGVTGRRGIES